MHDLALRTAAIITRVGHVSCVLVSGTGAFEALDRVSTQALFMLDGQMRQSLFLDEAGRIIADVSIARDDERFFVFAEGMSAAAVADLLGVAGADCDVEDMAKSRRHLAIDGPFAWEVVAAVLGPEVIGVPYLSFYRVREVLCFRAGKTGEYGYDLLVPLADADAIEAELRTRGAALGLVDGTREVLAAAAVENAFFDIAWLAAWRGEVVGPLELQLGWRLAKEREFVGASALRERVARVRLTSFTSDVALAPNTPIYFENERIGAVLVTARSAARGEVVGLALIDTAWAHAGIGRFVARGEAGEVAIRTRTPPLIANRSLFVDPHRHSAKVAEVYPPFVPEVLR